MDNLFFLKSENGEPIWTNKRAFVGYLLKYDKKTLSAKLEPLTGKRTLPQNNALHLYYDLLAKELNAAGYTVQLVLKETVDLSWDSAKVKELIWRPVQQALTGKKSTTELDKVSEIDEVYEHLNIHLGERFHIYVPWPSEQTKP